MKPSQRRNPTHMDKVKEYQTLNGHFQRLYKTKSTLDNKTPRSMYAHPKNKGRFIDPRCRSRSADSQKRKPVNGATTTTVGINNKRDTMINTNLRPAISTQSLPVPHSLYHQTNVVPNRRTVSRSGGRRRDPAIADVMEKHFYDFEQPMRPNAPRTLLMNFAQSKVAKSRNYQAPRRPVVTEKDLEPPSPEKLGPLRVEVESPTVPSRLSMANSALFHDQALKLGASATTPSPLPSHLQKMFPLAQEGRFASNAVKSSKSEEDAYSKFMLEVTDEIKSQGIYTDGTLRNIILTHAEINKNKLDPKRMKEMLKSFLAEIGIIWEDLFPTHHADSARDIYEVASSRRNSNARRFSRTENMREEAIARRLTINEVPYETEEDAFIEEFYGHTEKPQKYPNDPADLITDQDVEDLLNDRNISDIVKKVTGKEYHGPPVSGVQKSDIEEATEYENDFEDSDNHSDTSNREEISEHHSYHSDDSSHPKSLGKNSALKVNETLSPVENGHSEEEPEPSSTPSEFSEKENSYEESVNELTEEEEDYAQTHAPDPIEPLQSSGGLETIHSQDESEPKNDSHGGHSRVSTVHGSSEDELTQDSEGGDGKEDLKEPFPRIPSPHQTAVKDEENNPPSVPISERSDGEEFDLGAPPPQDLSINSSDEEDLIPNQPEMPSIESPLQEEDQQEDLGFAEEQLKRTSDSGIVLGESEIDNNPQAEVRKKRAAFLDKLSKKQRDPSGSSDSEGGENRMLPKESENLKGPGPKTPRSDEEASRKFSLTIEKIPNLEVIQQRHSLDGLDIGNEDNSSPNSETEADHNNQSKEADNDYHVSEPESEEEIGEESPGQEEGMVGLKTESQLDHSPLSPIDEIPETPFSQSRNSNFDYGPKSVTESVKTEGSEEDSDDLIVVTPIKKTPSPIEGSRPEPPPRRSISGSESSDEIGGMEKFPPPQPQRPVPPPRRRSKESFRENSSSLDSSSADIVVVPQKTAESKKPPQLMRKPEIEDSDSSGDDDLVM